jgi:hypothetical protein
LVGGFGSWEHMIYRTDVAEPMRRPLVNGGVKYLGLLIVFP